MPNEFYTPGGQRAEKVNDLFAAVARRYDLMNDLQSLGLHRVWKRRLVRMAGVQPGDRALDVCCGTGDIAFALADCGAVVTGLDFSESMLDIARARRRETNARPPKRHRTGATEGTRQNPEFVAGDAEHLPFTDDTFEIVTVGYGLRNLADWRAGLKEMRRVLKPGGRLLVLDFAKPDNAIWRGLYYGYLRCCVPALGRLVCGNAEAYAYILESLKHYPAQHGVTEQMRQMGLAPVEVINLLGGVMSIHCGQKPEARSLGRGI